MPQIGDSKQLQEADYLGALVKHSVKLTVIYGRIALAMENSDTPNHDFIGKLVIVSGRNRDNDIPCVF